jgi:hypothetical protein
LNQENIDKQSDYADIVKYSILYHVEKSEIDEDGSYSVEVISKMICPPDRMNEFENDVVSSLINFSKKMALLTIKSHLVMVSLRARYSLFLIRSNLSQVTV